MAFEALEEGQPVPAEARLPGKGGAPLPSQASEGPGAGVPAKPGMIVSQPGRPPAHIVIAAAAAPAAPSMRLAQPGSAFERLQMGQQRLGKGQGNEDANGVKALSKGAFKDIEREARLKHTLDLFGQVAAYYKASPKDIEAERARLSGLSAEELHAADRAYETAANHVKIMTDPAYAQQVARDSSKDLRQFFDKHGSTELQIESERESVQHEPKRHRRP